MDALRFITEIASLHYRFDKNVVIIEKEGRTGNVVTRFYSVDPNLFNERVGTMSAGGGGGGGGGFDDFGAEPFGDVGGDSGGGMGDLKALFTNYGVPFPPGSSITYEPVISQLIVANTPENLEKFEVVLDKINIQPRQIEIEARFVEVLQTDLEEVGFQHFITDDVELAIEDGPGPAASRQRIQIDQDPSGFTKGLRTFTFDAANGSTAPNSTLTAAGAASGTAANTGAGSVPLGGVLSFSSVLTNPELRTVVNLLDQRGNSDLLSAPRVTTINGVNAVIEVVREIIYPTEFDVSENDINVQGQGGAGGGIAGQGNQPFFVPPTVIPGAFETRETGVILNVTPTVSPDNYTINLTMLPEIAELVEWIQYGTTVGLANGQTYAVNMPQPIFASRNVTTSLIVWDGHTVVMGGLIREDLSSVDDKIPLFGDIPVLGQLFRNRGTRSEKRNLLIFVTARLVDPAGEPINVGKRGGDRSITTIE